MVFAECGYRLRLRKSTTQLHHLARGYPACGRPGDDPLKVPDVADIFLNLVQILAGLKEVLHNIVAAVQLLDVHYRHRQPASQKSRAHRGRAFVDDADQ